MDNLLQTRWNDHIEIICKTEQNEIRLEVKNKDPSIILPNLNLPPKLTSYYGDSLLSSSITVSQ